MTVSPRAAAASSFYRSVQELGLDEVITKYKLHSCPHPTLPLRILHYSFLHHVEESNVCRGLVWNTETSQIVSRGFDRFVKQSIPASEFQDVESCTIKEDGSLIFLFCFQGRWMVTTRYDFCDNLLSYPMQPGQTHPDPRLDCCLCRSGC